MGALSCPTCRSTSLTRPPSPAGLSILRWRRRQDAFVCASCGWRGFTPITPTAATFDVWRPLAPDATPAAWQPPPPFEPSVNEIEIPEIPDGDRLLNLADHGTEHAALGWRAVHRKRATDRQAVTVFIAIVLVVIASMLLVVSFQNESAPSVQPSANLRPLVVNFSPGP